MMRRRSSELFLALALSLVGCDARTEPLPDAGGADAGAVDAGSDAAGPTCREDLRAPFSGATPCSPATATCALGCDNASCAEDCFLADANGACIQCWDANQLACWNRNGCQAQWNCLAQCITDLCPTATVACIGANCAAEDLAYADCFEPERQVCLERTTDCLPPPG